MVTVASSELIIPSFAIYVNESTPVQAEFGVYVNVGIVPVNTPFEG